jgi:predicted phage tail protein
MKQLLLPLLLLALLASCSTIENHSASTVSIDGRVVDNRKHPVKAVRVQADGFKTVLTNDKGEFILTGPAPQADSLTVTFVAAGFKPTREVYKKTSRVAGNGSTVIIWPRAAGNGTTIVVWPRR